MILFTSVDRKIETTVWEENRSNKSARSYVRTYVHTRTCIPEVSCFYSIAAIGNSGISSKIEEEEAV